VLPENRWYKKDISFIFAKSHTNESGREAYMGASGKFYCGGPMEYQCMCCDTQCGMDDGCNCVHCMKLDLYFKGLPHEYLINREGYPARRGKTGLFYCGRQCLRGVSRSDGHCGPGNGPQCISCQTLQAQSKTRYRNLLNLGEERIEEQKEPEPAFQVPPPPPPPFINHNFQGMPNPPPQQNQQQQPQNPFQFNPPQQ